MAGPAVPAVSNIFLGMAVNAPAHLQRRDPGSYLHPGHIPVALMTGQAGLQMPLMREIDKVRKVVHLDPGDRLFPLPITGQFFYLRGLPFDDEVTADTSLNAGNPCYCRPGSIDMTIEAGDLVIPCMDSMTKGDRLLRASAGEVEDV